MKVKLRMEEAYQYARENGYALKKKELAERLFPGALAAKVNLTNLFSGHTRRVDIDLIVTICQEFGVSADYLFGLVDTPTGVNAMTGNLKTLLDQAAQALWQAKGELHKYEEGK